MFHYIRNKSKIYPYYNILEKKNFVNQIKTFKNKGLINSHEELFLSTDKFLPTFDDGLKDHVFAAEVLRKNDATGIFFISTLPLKENIILDTHKTHLILGKTNSSEALYELKKYLYKNKITSLVNHTEKLKYKAAYKKKKDNPDKLEFKKIMNFYGDLKVKHKILDYLLKKFEINVKAKNYYMNKKEIKYIESLGMIIGGHGESHTLLSRLSYRKQFEDLKNNKTFLEKIINKKIDTFCYPYGGKISYNNNTLKILKKLKYKLAFSVEYRDISIKDIKKKPYELPRYDCNLF